MFCKNLEETLNKVYDQAKQKGFSLTVEHLLFAILDNREGAALIQACGGHLKNLKLALKKHLKSAQKTLNLKPGQSDMMPSPEFQRVLQIAVIQVQSDGFLEVSVAHVLLAILTDHKSQTRSSFLLNQQKITYRKVLDFIHQNTQIENNTYLDDRSNVNIVDYQKSDNVIEKYAVNLNEQSRNNKLLPVSGRVNEIERCIEILNCMQKNNPVFVGEPGVGKTAIVEGLATRIVEGRVPTSLMYVTIYSLNIGALLAGTKYRGDFEKRMNQLLDGLEKNSKNSILFIDEIHNVLGAGAAGGNTIDAANLLKPRLGRGSMRVIGATTFKEKKRFDQDSALSRRFQTVVINEPTAIQASEMIKGLKESFKNHHGTVLSDNAIETAVKLSIRYISDRFLPDKAIDILDEACSRFNLKRSVKAKQDLPIEYIEQTIARLANIPAKHINTSDRKRLMRLERDLKTLVFGQDQAITQLVNSVYLSRSGLKDLDKPVGSYLFAGPTGVGKTEVCRLLAQTLGLKLLRFDMSEYMEKHNSSRLTGAPPGYVGFDQGGQLTDQVRKHPHCILLFDEIEKAHPDIFNVLLQAMDYGRITDNNGLVADFRHATIILTSNLGAEQFSKSDLGFHNSENLQKSSEAVNRFFRPEFRNRLDSVVTFNHLNQRVVSRVVDKFINTLEVQLSEKNVSICVSPQVKKWISKKGYSHQYGARPMQRVINEYIKRPLACEILFGGLKEGGIAQIDVENDYPVICVNRAGNQKLKANKNPAIKSGA